MIAIYILLQQLLAHAFSSKPFRIRIAMDGLAIRLGSII